MRQWTLRSQFLLQLNQMCALLLYSFLQKAPGKRVIMRSYYICMVVVSSNRSRTIAIPYHTISYWKQSLESFTVTVPKRNIVIMLKDVMLIIQLQGINNYSYYVASEKGLIPINKVLVLSCRSYRLSSNRK